MTFRALLMSLSLVIPLATAAHAEFKSVTFPSFADIEPRQVYGTVKYDVNFAGDGPITKGDSLKKFLADIIKSKFSNSSGNYIVTLTLLIDNKPVITEPIISANWDTQKFLFITTSEKKTIEATQANVLLKDIVIDNVTNRLTLSMKAYYSKNSSVDLSLFSAVSDLSRSATLSAVAPGLPAVVTAMQPFQDILKKLLEKYREETIVDNTVGVFTLLDRDLPNQLNFKTNRMSVNIYLQTENSQLPNNFDAATGKFKSTSPDAVLATVASGIGAARATVLDMIAQDNDRGNDDLKAFIAAVEKDAALAGGFATPVRPQCAALKVRLNKMVTTRDTSLVYWAFLKNYGTQIRRYTDAKTCADEAMIESLTRVGLTLGPEWSQ